MSLDCFSSRALRFWKECKGGIRGTCENNCTDTIIHPSIKLAPGINVQYKLESFGRRWSSNLHVEVTIGEYSARAEHACSDDQGL